VGSVFSGWEGGQCSSTSLVSCCSQKLTLWSFGIVSESAARKRNKKNNQILKQVRIRVSDFVAVYLGGRFLIWFSFFFFLRKKTMGSFSTEDALTFLV